MWLDCAASFGNHTFEFICKKGKLQDVKIVCILLRMLRQHEVINQCVSIKLQINAFVQRNESNMKASWSTPFSIFDNNNNKE